MDVAELRTAFTLSETVTERIRNFRMDRISKPVANETPVPFLESAKVVLHLIPIGSFKPGQTYDINKLASFTQNLTPIYSSAWDRRYNLDGLLTYSAPRNEQCRSYVQLFKNGIIEAVNGSLLDPVAGSQHGQGYIPSITFERELVRALLTYRFAIRMLEIQPPIFLFLTLQGVKG